MQKNRNPKFSDSPRFPQIKNLHNIKFFLELDGGRVIKVKC